MSAERTGNFWCTKPIGEIHIPTDIMPWLNNKSPKIPINACEATLLNGQTVIVTSAISKHHKLNKIAEKTQKEISEKLDKMFYDEIRKICYNNGYHCPALTLTSDVYYAKDHSSARAYFVETKIQDKPEQRVFVLVAVCGHKNYENEVIDILTGGVGKRR